MTLFCGVGATWEAVPLTGRTNESLVPLLSGRIGATCGRRQAEWSCSVI